MLFYTTLFFLFLYFKIARVHKKEERISTSVITQHIVVALSAFFLYSYGFNHLNPLSLLLVSFLFFIVVALMVTAVQLGIFIEGKPLFGIGKLFKLMPLFTGIIVILSVLTLLT